ncbi:MAG TPA: hypothetical protein VFL77_09880 [Solirubrobacterales bacterium]|nr:hypothetical protein [Solirubrobacterales bacterium]
MAGGAIEAVVVVPLEGGAFGTPVLDQVVEVGFSPTRLEQEVVARLSRREVVRDPAEVGDRLALGQAAGIAVELMAIVAAMEVNRELPGLLGQLVLEGDAGAPAGMAADGRSGEAAAEGPEPGPGAGKDLLLGLPDRDPDVVFVEDRRDRQPVAERNRGQRRRRFRGDRQQPAAPALQGQEDGERTAAEGAEEGPAPEAVCI